MSLWTSIPATRSYITLIRPPASCNGSLSEQQGKTSRPPEPQDQYRRLTHAHAAATGGTRHRAPAPNLHTASNGPRGIGDGRRQASSSLSARATHVSRSATQATQTAHGPQRPAELRCPVSSPRERREAAHVFLACHQQAARPPASIPAGHRPPASTRNRPSPGTLRYFPAVLPPSSDVAILPLGKDARTSWRMW